ncbi:flavin reductase [Yimella sp. RIT 621]|uniref:flavin reductase n=1 Tax=Yimella sp. RIT 621 TaxID=2510323 RepID=UPI0021016561|nr:flavin reductase [Yimella sp. RIT 621]
MECGGCSATRSGSVKPSYARRSTDGWSACSPTHCRRSLDPLLVSLAFSRTSTTWPVLREAKRWGISVLGDRHADLVSLLSRPTASRFEGIEFATCADGAAVLPQALASFTVDRHAQIDAGDHVLIMLHVLQLHRGPQQAATRLYLADADTPDIRLGKVHGTLMVDVVATNAKLQRRALRIVTETTGTDDATAAAALASCDGNAKSAITSVLLYIPAEEAVRRLAAVDGHLARVLSGGE